MRALVAMNVPYIVATCVALVSMTARGSELSSGVALSGNIAVPHQQDTHTFAANQGDNIMLRMADTGTTGKFRPRIRLYAPDGTGLASDSGYTAASLSFRAKTSGTYRIVVGDDNVNFSGDQVSSYRLNYVRAPGAIELGELVSGGTRRDVIDVGDLDSYSFHAKQGETVLLRVADTGTKGSFRPSLRLFGPDGSSLASDSGYTVASLGYRASATGVYTVVVADDDVNFEGSQTASYRIDFIRAPGANELGGLVNGGTRRDTIEVGDLDSYTFYAKQGESVLLRVADTGTVGAFRPRVQVFSPDGTSVMGDSGYTVASLSYNAGVTGVYTVVVADDDINFEGNQTASYRIDFVRAPGANERGSLINGGTLRDTIDIGDLDSYTFHANQGESITLRASDVGTTGSFRPRIRLFAPDGKGVAGNSGYTIASVGYKVASTGVYTVVLADDDINFEGNQTAPYTLEYTNDGARFSYVALGDSYSSGEGVWPYRDLGDTPVEGCHRSTRAYPTLVRGPGSSTPISRRNDFDFDFLACSGATTENVRADGTGQNGEPTQMDPGNAVNNRRDLITISIGGNDAQFANIFKYCMAHPDCNNVKPFSPKSEVTLGDLAPLLVAYAGTKVADIHARLRTAAPSANILVLGYPILLSGKECPAIQFPPFGESDLKLSASEQSFLRGMNRLLNEVIATSATLSGLHFIDVEQRFTGHEVCGDLDDWINGVVLFDPTFNPKASVHPTARGQQEYANAVNDYLAANSAGGVNGSQVANSLTPSASFQAMSGQLSAQLESAPAVLPEMGDLRVSLAVVPVGCDRLESVLIPGQSVRLRGDGFMAHETVSLSLVLSGVPITLGTVAADADGSLDTLVSIPIDVPTGRVLSVEALASGVNGAGRLLINISRVESLASLDSDGDGIPDLCDNCSAKPNPDQRDTDHDGYGNVCDADFDNNGIVNTLDLALLKAAFGQRGDDKVTDLDGNFIVDSLDLDTFKILFGKPPGPAFKALRSN